MYCHTRAQGAVCPGSFAKHTVPPASSVDSNYIVYPVGQANAGWKNNVADSEGEEVESDDYNDAYAAKIPESGDEDDED